MSNTAEKTSQQQQQSQTNPWAPAVPLLTSGIGKLQGISTDPTQAQRDAAGNLVDSTSGLPDFTGQGAGAVQNLFTSNNGGNIGLLNNGYDALKANLSPIASGSQLDPYSTPGFGTALSTAADDITKRVKDVYNSSGRDPSGAGSFAGSLSRGLAQGLAPTIASQFNTNQGNMLNANSTLFNAAGSTATGASGLQQRDLTNGLTGIQGGTALGGLSLSPGLAQLQAAGAQQGLDMSTLAPWLQSALALGGAGNTSSGSASGTQTSTPGWMDQVQSGFKTAGTVASGLGSIFALSDEDLKTDIKPVGKLAHGPKVVSYRMKGAPKSARQVGVLAQDVEKYDPGAVAEVDGVKMVNYPRATRGAMSGPVGALRRAA